MKTQTPADMAGNPRTVTLCVLFSLAWSAFAVLLLTFFPGFFDNINFKIYDWKFSFSQSRTYSPDIVHLDIDDHAVKEFGPWPWDRAFSAKIVERMTEFGASLVVFDVFYASPGKSREGNLAFFGAIKRAGNVISATAISGLAHTDEKKLQIDQDRSQANAIYDAALPLQAPPQFKLLKVVDLRGSVLPLAPIIQASKGVGHIAATPDPDGVYRKIALLVRLEDRCIPSLSLSALLAYWNVKPDSISFDERKGINIKHGGDTVRIPLDHNGMMLVNWGQSWESFKHYSARDVLSEEPDASRPGRYKDKIVVIAVTATGNADIGKTPLSMNAPLNRIHSHSINTCLTKSFIERVPIFSWISIVLAAFAIAFPLATSRLSLGWEAISVGLACLVCFCLEVLCFALLRYDVPLIANLLVFLPALLGSFIIRGTSIETQAAQTRRALERYLPPELLEAVFSRGTSLDLSSRREEVTIMFLDMQGFSTLSESVETEYIRCFLRDFFERMSSAIVARRGRVHQFLGDGFLAVFGDLIPLDDHAVAALEAAMEMQRQMTKLSAKWSASGIKEFEQGLKIRIGINTGVVFVGDLGSDRRLEYAVVGSAVNIASRLQSLAPPGGIALTSRTKALVRDVTRCEGPQSVHLKGIDKEMDIYTIHPYAIEVSPSTE